MRCSSSASSGSLSSSNFDDLDPCREADTLCENVRRLGTRELHGVAGAEREEVRVVGEILEVLTG